MITATIKPKTRTPGTGVLTSLKTDESIGSNNESNFKESLQESIIRQWRRFEYYRNICKNKGLNLEDLKKAIKNEEYYILPAVPSLAFKKSKGLAHELNDFSVEGKFQVSSSTSGDPSYVYTNQPEIDTIFYNYMATFGIEGIARAIAFAPTIRILESLSKKSSYLGIQSIARMKFALDAGQKYYSDIQFSLDVNILKSLFSLTFQNKPTFSKLSQEDLVDRLKSCEENKQSLVVGGVVQLMAPYLNKLKEGQFNFHDKIHVVSSGGGYSGMKGAITRDKISKSELARKISAVFGMDEKYLSTNFKDIYGFTESPATHEGYWNEDIDDFMFTPWHDSRVYIVDPETDKPLKQGKGLFKVISPYKNGRPSSCNTSIVQYDQARIFGVTPDYRVTHFSHISRFQTASMEGLSVCPLT